MHYTLFILGLFFHYCGYQIWYTTHHPGPPCLRFLIHYFPSKDAFYQLVPSVFGLVTLGLYRELWRHRERLAENFSPTLSQTSHGHRGNRERQGTRRALYLEPHLYGLIIHAKANLWLRFKTGSLTYRYWYICLLNTILSKVIGGGGFSVCRNFLFPVIANAGIFVPGNTLCRIFFGRANIF